MCGNSRTFASQWILGYLDKDLLSFSQYVLYGLAVLFRMFTLFKFYGIVSIGEKIQIGNFIVGIRHIQKSASFMADIDKCGLHARKYSNHLTHIYVSGYRPLIDPLHIEIRESVIFQYGNPCFIFGTVKNDFFWHHILFLRISGFELLFETDPSL